MLRGSPVGVIDASRMPSPIRVPARPGRNWVLGEPLDFDSVQAATLDRFTYVITTRTGYASSTPSNFLLARRTRLFELWRRTGPTAERQPFETGPAPGAVLDCRVPAYRRLARQTGQAGVMPAPVVAGPIHVPGDGRHAQISLLLPRGVWELSASYFSPQPLHVSVAGAHLTFPAYLGRPGPVFSAGTVRSPGGPVALSISMAPGFWDVASRVPLVSELAATRTDIARAVVPLRRACGRYVDWYRTAG
jgi:hypothetical protein